MADSTCAQCNVQAETRWRIDLERTNGSATERSQYRLCRNCWETLCGRFAGATPNDG
jgi:hypothetical protein